MVLSCAYANVVNSLHGAQMVKSSTKTATLKGDDLTPHYDALYDAFLQLEDARRM